MASMTQHKPALPNSVVPGICCWGAKEDQRSYAEFSRLLCLLMGAVDQVSRGRRWKQMRGQGRGTHLVRAEKNRCQPL